MKISKCLHILILSSIIRVYSNALQVKADTLFVSCGHNELDELRIHAIKNPTTILNVAERRSGIYSLWRLLWRQGYNMSSFDKVANDLIICSNDNPYVLSVIDNGFNQLEKLISNPVFIPEVEGAFSSVKITKTTKTNWPVYHGVDGTQNGYSPDEGPSKGVVAWKYPKTNGWNGAAVIRNNRIYTTGADTHVVAFCLDQNTGEIIWRGKRNSESFYHERSPEASPQISGNGLFVKTATVYHKFNLDTGKKEFSRNFNESDKNIKPIDFVISSFHNRVVSCNDSETGAKIWSFYSQGLLINEPVRSGNSVFLIDSENYCYKLNLKTGKLVWRKEFKNDIRGSISIADGKVLFGFKSGVLLALDNESGNKLWEFKSNKDEPRAYEFYSKAIGQNGYIYIGGADKYMYCIDARTGKKVWSYETEDWLRSKPVIVDDYLSFADLSGTAYALKLKKKKYSLVWKNKISDHGYTADIVGNEVGLLFSDRNMILTSVKLKSGIIQWKHSQLDGVWIKDEFYASGEISGQQSSPTIVDGILYIASPDGFVNAVDTETGKEIWKYEIKGSSSPSPTVAEGKVFVGQTYNSYGTYFALNKDTGIPVWSTKDLGSVWISAAYSNSKLFLGNMMGDFFAINPSTGDKLWNYFTAKDTPDENKPLVGGGHGWPPGVYCNPITEGNVVYSGSWAGYYFALNQDSGELLWRTKTKPDAGDGGVPDSAAPVLHKNHLYVQQAGHKLSALNKKTGQIDWSWKAKPGFLQNGTVAAFGDKVFASTAREITSLPYNATIHAFSDIESGSELLWEYKGGGGLTAPVLTKDKLIFGSSADPFITCLNPETGSLLWRKYVGGTMLESVPSIYGNKVFALVKNGYLYAIE